MILFLKALGTIQLTYTATDPQDTELISEEHRDKYRKCCIEEIPCLNVCLLSLEVEAVDKTQNAAKSKKQKFK